VRAAFDNVATATGTRPSGPNVTARDSARVTAAALKPANKKKKHPKGRLAQAAADDRPVA